MKFQSPFALGQLVARASQLRSSKSDDFAQMEVLQISFDIEGGVSFLCEDINTGNRQYYLEHQLTGIGLEAGHNEFDAKMGLREIVIRESHKNGEMVQERMMEVISVIISAENEAHYLCEDTHHGHRQVYSESMLVGDPDFDQQNGAYPKSPEETNHTNAVPVEV